MNHHVELLQRAYQRWEASRAADTAAWTELISDDVLMSSLGDAEPELEFASQRRGRDLAHQYFFDITKAWEMNFFRAEQFIAEGDWVVMQGRCGWTFRTTQKAVESPIVHVFRFQDGKITEFHEFFDTARALAATRAES
ncbi:MAG: nuclear transport factor 2 family protein [Planctomycetes bacterium]|nr:nuclear transport factor 2 family protein [Planctomycetota bacterium]